MKPGFKTTEFWITVAIVILTELQLYVGGGVTIEEALMIASAVLAALGYSVSRGVAKGKNGK